VQTIEYTASPDAPVVGVFDRQERESYGYADVKTILNDGSSVARTFNNQDYYQKELLGLDDLESDRAAPAARLAGAQARGRTPMRIRRAGIRPRSLRARDRSSRRSGNTDTFLIRGRPAGRAEAPPGDQAVRQGRQPGPMSPTPATSISAIRATISTTTSIYVHPDAAGLITRPSAITATTGLGVIFRRVCGSAVARTERDLLGAGQGR
jgi:hypothetical protein